MGDIGNTQRDRGLYDLAVDQLGLLRGWQLRAAGLTRQQVHLRTKKRVLSRLYADVYVLGHTVLRDEAYRLGALWATGDTTALSHDSASHYYGWTLPEPGADVHLSTTAAIKSRPGIVVHRVSRLDEKDVFRPEPFRVTTIPRAFVDLADRLPWEDYRALADAQRQLDVRAIAAAQARAGRRVGRGRVRRLVEADDAHTKSEFERRYLRVARAHGIPAPDGLNVRVAGHKADCLHRGPRLVIELDGRTYHQRRAQMRADRRRDLDYQLAGYRIRRLVWDDLHPDEAARTADGILRLLALGA